MKGLLGFVQGVVTMAHMMALGLKGWYSTWNLMLVCLGTSTLWDSKGILNNFLLSGGQILAP